MAVVLEEQSVAKSEPAWLYTLSDARISSYLLVELFTVDNCKQLLAVQGVEGGKLQIYRWDGEQMRVVFDGSFGEYVGASGNLIGNIQQEPGAPFKLVTDQWSTRVSQKCVYMLQEYEWGGDEFMLTSKS